jgi:hypothetical protein
MGIGHRIYKTYDPRAKYFKEHILPKIFGDPKKARTENPELWNLYETAITMERFVQDKLGKKKLYPNVDFWSGLFYKGIGAPTAPETNNVMITENNTVDKTLICWDNKATSNYPSRFYNYLSPSNAGRPTPYHSKTAKPWTVSVPGFYCYQI